MSDRLTKREQEVLSWVALGKTNGEVAQILWLAPSTVRKHLENVYAKLGVRTRTGAVARFVGLIDPERIHPRFASGVEIRCSVDSPG